MDKLIETNNKNTTTSHEGLQKNYIINAVSDCKLLCNDSKLNSQCMILIKKFDVNAKSNVHIKSNNTNLKIKSSKNNDCIISSRSNKAISYDDPKLILQCSVLIEQFNYTELNKHVESGNKNTNLSSKGLQNNDSVLSDTKLNLQCIVLIETDVDISGVKSSIDLQNNVKTTCREKSDKCYNSCKKVNWKNSSTCIAEKAKTDCEMQNKISSTNYISTNRAQLPQKKILSTTNDEKKLYTKVKIETGANQYLNQLTSPIYWEKKHSEILATGSNEEPFTDFIFNKKVSLYNKQNEDTKCKESIDLYEFDEFDTNTMTIHKKRNFNNSRQLNRPMYILQNIDVKKTKLKVKNKNRRNIGRRSKTYKYNETMKGIIQKIMRKVYMKNNFENHDYRDMVINDKNIKNIPAHKKSTSNISNMSVDEDDSKIENSCEEFFGFNSSSHSTPSKINPNINIISNVTFFEGDSTNLFHNINPSGSSTMFNDKYKPWRFSENVQRNPHFIIIKKSALPCLQQDMVLDYIQLEKIEKHFSTTQKKNENLKTKSVQKSIRDFVNVSSYDINHEESIPHLNSSCNLFDYDDFSPNKIMSQNILKRKNENNILTPSEKNTKNVQGNISTQNKSISNDKLSIRLDVNNEVVLHEDKNKLLKARRHCINQNVIKKYTKQVTQTEILGRNLQESLKCQPLINNNELELCDHPDLAALSIQNKTISNHKLLPENNIYTYFGGKNANNEMVLPEDKPRSYQDNQNNKKFTKEVVPTEISVHNLPELQESFENQSIMFSKEVGLFEDPERAIPLNMPSRIYESKKRKRIISEAVDENESKPNKNMMNKRKEAEKNGQHNSMVNASKLNNACWK